MDSSETVTLPEDPVHTPSPAYDIALAQFHAAADRLDLDDVVRARLAVPHRELITHFPVKMDDGTHRLFTGFRVQHNLARGPALRHNDA